MSLIFFKNFNSNSSLLLLVRHLLLLAMHLLLVETIIVQRYTVYSFIEAQSLLRRD